MLPKKTYMLETANGDLIPEQFHEAKREIGQPRKQFAPDSNKRRCLPLRFV